MGIKLVGLVIVIAIIALLANLVLVVVFEARRRAHESPCMTNLRQIYIAWRNYVDDNQGAIPKDLYAVRSYLKATEVLRCPRDVWGGVKRSATQQWGVPVSYGYLPIEEPFLTLLQEKDPNHGILYCILHGKLNIGEQSLTVETPEYLTTGTVLRLRRDGSIQRAKVHLLCYKHPQGGLIRIRHPWHLLTDVRPCPYEVCFVHPEHEIRCPLSFF